MEHGETALHLAAEHAATRDLADADPDRKWQPNADAALGAVARDGRGLRMSGARRGDEGMTPFLVPRRSLAGHNPETMTTACLERSRPVPTDRKVEPSRACLTDH